MNRFVNISQSVDPNTFVLDIHEQHRTRISLLLSRNEVEDICNKSRALLGDPPTVHIPDAKLAVFPRPEEKPFKIGIVNK